LAAAVVVAATVVVAAAVVDAATVVVAAAVVEAATVVVAAAFFVVDAPELPEFPLYTWLPMTPLTCCAVRAELKM